MSEAAQTTQPADQPWWATFEVVCLATLGGALAMSLATITIPGSFPNIVAPALVAAVLVAGFAWRPTAGLVAFSLFILFYDTIAFFLGSPLRRVDEMAVPALVIVALVRLRPWRYVRIEPVRDGAVAVAVALGILSSLVNGVPAGIWIPALGLLWKTVAIFYIATWLQIDRRSIIGAARVVLSVGFVVVGLAFIESFNPSGFQGFLGLPQWYRPRGQLPAVKSLFLHPAIFASFAGLVALYAYTSYVEYRKVWMLVLGTFAGMTVFFAARRRAIIGVVAALAAAFGWSWRRLAEHRLLLRSWLPVMASGVVLFLIFTPGLLGLYDKTLIGYAPQPTDLPTPPPGMEPDDGEGRVGTQARSALYGASFEIAQDYFPLGAGLGRYGSHMSRVEYSPVYETYDLNRVRGLQPGNPQFITDTFWPMILGEGGVLAVLAYATFLLAVLLSIWVGAGRQADRLVRTFCLGTLAVLVLALVESAATPMFVSPPRAFLIFAAVGAAVAVIRRPPASEDAYPG
ncbi:MAG TPA: hypothetical protein VFH90_02455 [Candidatus Limnocylindria bacterium]|nr:hypothetical protein [Candidatus Limnocylindria bacterium]